MAKSPHYKPLFRVDIACDYFVDNRFSEAVVLPTVGSQGVINVQGLKVLPHSGGVSVVYDTNRYSVSARDSFSRSIVFMVNIPSSLVAQVCVTKPVLNFGTLIFETLEKPNSSSPAELDANERVNNQGKVGQADQLLRSYLTMEERMGHPYCLIIIDLPNLNVVESAGYKPTEFTLQFSSKLSIWRYLFHPVSFRNAYTIVDKFGGTHQFSSRQKSADGESAYIDICSQSAIRFQQRYAHQFQLLDENKQVIFSHLPSPCLRQIAKPDKLLSSDVSDIYVNV